MGVVNVTPDSFSDGGQWFEPDAAITHARGLLADGADLLDIGGESTRPGASRPSVDEELRRVIPVVSALAAEGARVSIDTMRAEVAGAALAAGAALVNDVSGGLADPQMLPLVAAAQVPFVVMHWRGHSVDMQDRAAYADVVAEVCRELASRRDAALAAGIRAWALLAGLPALRDLGQPILLGASRKAFLGKVGRPEHVTPRPSSERDVATAATTVLAGLAGVWAVRVHDVRSTRDALDVLEATQAHGGTP